MSRSSACPSPSLPLCLSVLLSLRRVSLRLLLLLLRMDFVADLHVRRRKPVLFVGTSGTGKTTIVKVSPQTDRQREKARERLRRQRRRRTGRRCCLALLFVFFALSSEGGPLAFPAGGSPFLLVRENGEHSAFHIPCKERNSIKAKRLAFRERRIRKATPNTASRVRPRKPVGERKNCLRVCVEVCGCMDIHLSRRPAKNETRVLFKRVEERKKSLSSFAFHLLLSSSYFLPRSLFRVECPHACSVCTMSCLAPSSGLSPRLAGRHGFDHNQPKLVHRLEDAPAHHRAQHREEVKEKKGK